MNKLELAVPVWSGAVRNSDKTDIERVRKCALHIILGDQYLSNADALDKPNLDSLDTRRESLCLRLTKKAVKDVKHIIGPSLSPSYQPGKYKSDI